jgi:hypothetical protein
LSINACVSLSPEFSSIVTFGPSPSPSIICCRIVFARARLSLFACRLMLVSGFAAGPCSGAADGVAYPATSASGFFGTTGAAPILGSPTGASPIAAFIWLVRVMSLPCASTGPVAAAVGFPTDCNGLPPAGRPLGDDTSRVGEPCNGSRAGVLIELPDSN